MCGICGSYTCGQGDVTLAELRAMNETMLDRGPDGDGFFVDKDFGMAMRRLAIIDIAGGYQPHSSEDGSIQVVLNGEIYNYIELREQLEKRGHVFRSHSDVEVVAHLYEEKGLKAIEDLNGMFGFCLWDARKRRMWLGRDRLGIKPLLWRRHKGGISFASTLTALRSQGGWKPEVDADSLILYMLLAYVPAPRTIYKDVYKLMPGHWLTLDADGSVHIEQYWSAEQPEAEYTEKEFTEKAEALLHDSARLQARSDVPVGCYLSGGIDSSLITAFFSNNYGSNVHTLNMEFEGKDFRESPIAAEVGRFCNTQHHTWEVGTTEGLQLLQQIVPRMDEPLGDSAVIPSFALSSKAREMGLTVMLSGAGGDELFGGYTRQFPTSKEWAADILGAVPASLWSRLLPVLPRLADKGCRAAHWGARLALASSGVKLDAVYNVCADKDIFFRGLELLNEHCAPALEWRRKYGYTKAAMLVDCTQYLPDNILPVQDKTSMAASVEARVPMLDHRLVELAFSAPQACIPDSFSQSKKVLRSIGKKVLPPSVFNRPKAGFNSPIQAWLQNQQFENIMETTAGGIPSSIQSLIRVPAMRDWNSGMTTEQAETVFHLYTLALWNTHCE